MDLPPSSTPMPAGQTSSPPREWVEFLRHLLKTDPQGFNKRFAADPATITLTPQSWQKIETVASSLPLKTYEHQSGQPWRDSTNVTAADCNGFTLARRRALAAAGFPLGALRPVVANNMNGEPHMALSLETDKGTFIMDGTTPLLQPWQRLPYQWRYRLNGHSWEKLSQ